MRGTDEVECFWRYTFWDGRIGEIRPFVLWALGGAFQEPFCDGEGGLYKDGGCGDVVSVHAALSVEDCAWMTRWTVARLMR